MLSSKERLRRLSRMNRRLSLIVIFKSSCTLIKRKKVCARNYVTNKLSFSIKKSISKESMSGTNIKYIH